MPSNLRVQQDLGPGRTPGRRRAHFPCTGPGMGRAVIQAGRSPARAVTFRGGAPKKRGSGDARPAPGAQVPSDDRKPSPGFAPGFDSPLSGYGPAWAKCPPANWPSATRWYSGHLLASPTVLSGGCRRQLAVENQGALSRAHRGDRSGGGRRPHIPSPGGRVHV